MYIPSSKRPFSLLAPHELLGEQSQGLGLYFDTFAHFAVLMLVLFVVVGCYVMADAREHNAMSTNFNVREITSAGAVTEVACERVQTPSDILKTSHGSRCNDWKLASYYNCPTDCEITVTTAASSSASDLCGTYLPCTLSGLSAEQAGRCCAETLQSSLRLDSNATPTAVYAMQIVTTFIMIVWQSFFHHRQLVKARKVNKRALTVGDYAVYVRGLGRNTYTREQVAAFFAHYGEVASVSMTTTLGKVLHSEMVLAKQQRHLREIEEWKASRMSAKWSHFYDIRLMMFKLTQLGRVDPMREEGVARLREKIEAREAAVFEELEDPEAFANLGEAFVTFNYEEHANNCLDDHHTEEFYELASSCFARRERPTFEGKKIGVYPPPEPSDVYWENFAGMRGGERNERALYGNATILLSLGVASLIQWIMETLRQNYRVVAYDRYTIDRLANGGDTDWTLQIRLRVLSALASLVIILMNLLLTLIVKGIAKFRRFHTRTDRECYLMSRLTVIHTVNCLVIPILNSSCPRTDDRHGRCLWYAPGGLVEGAFWLQFFNAFVPDLIYAMYIGGLVKKQMAKLARTQATLDELFVPRSFSFGEKYAALCKTIALALFYGPVLPLSYVLAVCGLFVSYCADKYWVLRDHKRPAKLRNETTTQLVRILAAINLAQVLLMGLGWYYHGDDDNLWIYAVTMWAAFQIFPIKRLLGIRRDETLEDGGTDHTSYWFNMGRRDAHGKEMSDSGTMRAPEHVHDEADEEDEAQLVKAPSLKKKWESLSLDVELRLLGVSKNELDRGRLKMYWPYVPVNASKATVDRLVDKYHLFDEIYPANPELMVNQKLDTGGPEWTAPPAVQLQLKRSSKILRNTPSRIKRAAAASSTPTASSPRA